MAKQNQRTECSGMEWGQFLTLIESLKRLNENKFLLFVSLGGYCGMRIGDILSLKWEQIIGKDEKILVGRMCLVFRRLVAGAGCLYTHPDG